MWCQITDYWLSIKNFLPIYLEHRTDWHSSDTLEIRLKLIVKMNKESILCQFTKGHIHVVASSIIGCPFSICYLYGDFRPRDDGRIHLEKTLLMHAFFSHLLGTPSRDLKQWMHTGPNLTFCKFWKWEFGMLENVQHIQTFHQIRI